MTRLFRYVAWAAVAAALSVLLAPLGYAAWMSFAPGELLDPPTDVWSLRWYRAFLSSAKWTAALRVTAEVAGVSALLATVVGSMTAVAVSRIQFVGRRIVVGLVMLPLGVPAVVLGLGLLPVAQAVGLGGTVWAVSAAHAVVTLPVVFLLVRAALDGLDPNLEPAARGLGAGPLTAFRRVTLPLVWPAVAAGAVLAVVLSVNEFTLAVFLGTPRTRTLPAALWPEARDKETPLLAAAACLSAAVTLAGVAAVGWAMRVGNWGRSGS